MTKEQYNQSKEEKRKAQKTKKALNKYLKRGHDSIMIQRLLNKREVKCHGKI